MNIYKKLMEARMMLQAEKLKKSGHNKFAGYEYFELGDFLPPTQRIFAELGLCGIVSFAADKATLTITDTDANGPCTKSIVIESPMAEANLKGCHPIQNLGATQKYLRRYLWVTAMEIVEHDELDATTGKDVPKSAKSVTQDVRDNLSADRREILHRMAADVIAALDESDEQGFAAYTDVKITLDADEQVAFWHFFDSKQRAKIKAIGGIKRDN